MAKSLFGLLVVAALGVTGYFTYSYVHNGGCCHSDGMAVKSSCCQSQAAKTCCSESGECTGACGQGDGAEAKCCSEKKEGCCEGKEGSCCKDKNDDGKKEKE